MHYHNGRPGAVLKCPVEDDYQEQEFGSKYDRNSSY